MRPLRVREDEAAYSAWLAGVAEGKQMFALMRKMIDAVDRVRARDALKDKDESTEDRSLLA